jgi:hypothetical protein
MPVIGDQFTQADTTRTVFLPKYGDQAFVTRDQFQLSDRRLDYFVGKTHRLFPSAYEFADALLKESQRGLRELR